ncbi:hypothetical protein [Pseudomonas sp. NPDC088444]|uniref:hypothetical protein n=1 Tax=Pseudomonas sp. NPDC088444 TaxID=3364456 RepID=UPI00385022B1
MGHKAFLSEQMDSSRYAVERIAAIRSRATTVLDKLAQSSADEFIVRTWGISVIPDGNASAKIVTPFGEGRAELSFRIGERGIYGRYEIQRLGRDQYDRATWSPVWEFRIDGDDNVTHGDSSENSFDLFAPYRDSFPKLLLAILTAFGQ